MATSVGAQAAKVYFNNPSGWTEVYAYFYKGSTNNTWPGNAMSKATGDAYYSIDVPSAYEGGYVIFNNNNKGEQYPAATGKQLTTESMVCSWDSDNDENTIWTEYNAEAIEVYFDNSTENWATPYFYSWGVKGENATWPGTAMTLNEGSVWKATLPAGTCGVIFTNGASSDALQSVNFAATDGATYNRTAVVSGGTSGPVAEAYTVYFDNSTKNWATPKVHYFGGETTSTWPGVNMTLESGKVYQYTVPAGTTGVVFNDGNGNQTSDITPTANHLYDGNGTDKGEYTPGSGSTVETPAALYILGTIGDTNWATTPGVTMTKNGNKFSATNVEIKASKAGDTYGYFTLVTTVGDSWDTVNSGDRYGAEAENTELTSGVAAAMKQYVKNVDASSAKSWKLETGKYTIEADFATMQVTATLTGSGPVAGTGALAITPITINPGRDATLEISIADADKVMKALQFDIALPSCVSAGSPLISRTMGNHTLMSSTVDGKLRVVIFSETNESFSTENGALIYLPITATASAEDGQYDVTLSNITFADADLLSVNIAEFVAENAITVENASDYTITLNKTVVALSPAATVTLTAEVTPHDGTDETVTWTSGDTDVATVTSEGVVTAVANGTAVITAACKGATATCTIYVGKQGQTITWEQAIPNLGVGEEDYQLTATASSGLGVTFEITSGAAYATIVDGKLHAVAAGIVTITATQAGNDTYAPAEPVSKNVTIWLGYYPGDVNDDDEITLVDVVTTVNHILGNNPASFNEDAADVNGDGQINVADVALIVDLVLKSNPSGLRGLRADAVAGEQFAMTLVNYGLQVTFSNQQDYVASIFEVTLPEGVEITAATIAGSDHKVATRNIGANTYRVAVYSLTNSNFASDGCVNITLNVAKPAMAKLDNASVVATDGINSVETRGIGTDIDMSGIEAALVANEAGEAVYYTLQGVRVANPTSGVYVRVLGNKASKVLVK